jgi:hypothetical protein
MIRIIALLRVSRAVAVRPAGAVYRDLILKFLFKIPIWEAIVRSEDIFYDNRFITIRSYINIY